MHNAFIPCSLWHGRCSDSPALLLQAVHQKRQACMTLAMRLGGLHVIRQEYMKAVLWHMLICDWYMQYVAQQTTCSCQYSIVNSLQIRAYLMVCATACLRLMHYLKLGQRHARQVVTHSGNTWGHGASQRCDFYHVSKCCHCE